MRIFLAGIMQGSHTANVLHDQQYRDKLRDLLSQYFPGAEIYDPLADHRQSLHYDEATAREVFYRHNRMCRQVDLLVAYVPEASMGTAIEMWEAHEHGRGLVVAISPLRHNWAVRFCSHLVYADLEQLQQALREGEIQSRLAAARRNERRPGPEPTSRP